VLGVLLAECQKLRVESLVDRRVYDLRVYLLLVLVLGVHAAPVYRFAASGGQAYAVDVEGVELWRFLWRVAPERHLPDLKLRPCVKKSLLLLPLSILLQSQTTELINTHYLKL